jgi:hypothetical protein
VMQISTRCSSKQIDCLCIFRQTSTSLHCFLPYFHFRSCLRTFVLSCFVPAVCELFVPMHQDVFVPRIDVMVTVLLAPRALPVAAPFFSHRCSLSEENKPLCRMFETGLICLTVTVLVAARSHQECNKAHDNITQKEFIPTQSHTQRLMNVTSVFVQSARCC